MTFTGSRAVATVCLSLGMLGAALTASGIWIHAKSALAQVLLEHAWQQTLDGNPQAKPWPWADTWPVARMRVPALDLDFIVLSGGTGNALAFGPSHQPVSAQPGSPGHVILGGHRDTHFSFLQEFPRGGEIQVQGTDGRWRVYEATEFEVADVRRDRLMLDEAGHRLTLVTCFPFDAMDPGGPLRYVVDAFPVARQAGRGAAYTET